MLLRHNRKIETPTFKVLLQSLCLSASNDSTNITHILEPKLESCEVWEGNKLQKHLSGSSLVQKKCFQGNYSEYEQWTYVILRNENGHIKVIGPQKTAYLDDNMPSERSLSVKNITEEMKTKPGCIHLRCESVCTEWWFPRAAPPVCGPGSWFTSCTPFHTVAFPARVKSVPSGCC